MPAFTFNGFPLGSSVSVSALQSGNNAANSVASWGQGSAMADIDILVTTAPNVVAPAAVWLEATGISGFDVGGGPAPGETYDPSFHEITYVWTIEGAPLPPYAAPQNMVSGWNNANIAYGKRVGFCLTEARDYTIQLWAIDASGTTGIASTTITVRSPEDVYSAANTVVFAPDGDFTGAPAGAQITSMSTLSDTISGHSAATRLSIKGGLDIADFSLRVSSGRLSHLDTWDGTETVLRSDPTSDNPTLRWTGAGESQITIQNIRFQGEWDATEELGVLNNGLAWNQMDRDDPVICLHKVTVSGGYSLSPGQGNSTTGDARIMIADCVATNWRGYGIYCQNVRGGKVYVLGCRLAQDPDALNGGTKNSSFYNINSGFRDEDCSDIYIGCTDVFNITGWSGSYVNQNPCLRFGGNGPQNPSVVVDRVVCEGGYNVIRFSGESSDVTDHPGNILIDRALIVGTARTFRTLVRVDRGGFTARNCIGYMPDVPLFGPNTPSVMFDFDPDNSGSGNLTSPVAIYNNTLLSLFPGSNMSLAANNGFQNYAEENNLTHVPNSGSPVTDDQPVNTALSQTIPGVTLRFRGVRYNYDHQTGSESVANGSSFTVPYSQIGQQDIFGYGPSGATDQAYWQATPDARHMVSTGGTLYQASRGDFTVSFEQSQVRITNTSGENWDGTWYLRLDRASRRETELPVQTQFANHPNGVPEPVPSGNSQAIDTAVLGYRAYHDFYRAARGGARSRGAIEV
ncbi:MAG: hypothetical protein AAFU34_14055 [Pseudomonadota bacterium]